MMMVLIPNLEKYDKKRIYHLGSSEGSPWRRVKGQFFPNMTQYLSITSQNTLMLGRLTCSKKAKTPFFKRYWKFLPYRSRTLLDF